MRAVVGLAVDGPGVIVERLVVVQVIALVVPEALLVVVQPVVDHFGKVLQVDQSLVIKIYLVHAVWFMRDGL